MERYEGVRGRLRVKLITAALEQCGAVILQHPDPSVAPFEYRIRTPEGETLDLVCYAFTANKYGQLERPLGEHRFQVKYGGDFKRLHEIYVDPARAKITLMFGVHEELGLFVAVDPVMHRLTWFSSSVEFKEDNLRLALEGVGWHGWERERVAGGRRRSPLEAAARDEEDLRVEALLALRPERFLRYVQLERFASGIDPAERLLLIDRIEQQLARPPATETGTVLHPLEEQLGLSSHEILDVIGGRGRLLTAVLGGAAEHHLERYLRSERDITDVTRVDEDGPPDFSVRYRSRTPAVRIECKNVRRVLSASGPWVDFQKTRAAQGNPCSRYYAATQFEVLAACLHPVSERWEFRFRETARLPPHKDCVGKLAVRVVVDEASWTPSLPELLDRFTA